jgi:hypothetical protein
MLGHRQESLVIDGADGSPFFMAANDSREVNHRTRSCRNAPALDQRAFVDRIFGDGQFSFQFFYKSESDPSDWSGRSD